MSQKLQYWFVHSPNTVKTTYNVTLVPLVATDKLLWENTEQNDINTTLYRHPHPHAHTLLPNTSATQIPAPPTTPQYPSPTSYIPHHPNLFHTALPHNPHKTIPHPPPHTLQVHRVSSSKVLDILCPFTKVTWICHVF